MPIESILKLLVFLLRKGAHNFLDEGIKKLGTAWWCEDERIITFLMTWQTPQGEGKEMSLMSFKMITGVKGISSSFQ